MGTIDPRLQVGQRRLAVQLGQIDWALPGSVVTRMMRCGKRACRCRHDPPQLHGPYIQWTRTVEGKTVTKLFTPEQLDRYQPWLENARRLRELVSELETLTVQAVEHAEGWELTPPKVRRTRSKPLWSLRVSRRDREAVQVVSGPVR